eukprot:8152808-Alexandrium_andersonii.AAC.1
MLSGIAHALKRLIQWVDGCSCHWHLEHEFREQARRSPQDDCAEARALWKTCPLRGRRLPEVASGDFFEDMAAIFCRTGAHLLAKLPADLGEQARAQIISDFERGRSHLGFTLSAKLAHWQSPPWCMYAMAHREPHVAAAAYEKVVQAGP